MKLIVCLDDNNAMAFHNRRLSSDFVVTERIFEMVSNHRLWLDSYSGYLFADFNGNIQIDNDFLSKAEENDFCFVETADVSPFISKVTEIYVFRWNRVYPGDLFFPEIPAKKQVLSEFAGNSHERITLEAYRL